MEQIHFGQLLKELAEQRKIGTSEIGRRMGVKSQSINQLYKTPSVGTLVLLKFCSAIDVNPITVFERIGINKLQDSEGNKLEDSSEQMQALLEKLKEKDNVIRSLTESLKNVTETLGKSSASNFATSVGS